jgi:hypothetical protein
MSMRLIEEKELEVRNDDIEILVDRITELEEMVESLRDIVLFGVGRTPSLHKRITDLEEKINPYTKKTTPNSPSFTDEKKGENSVKDMSVSLTK